MRRRGNANEKTRKLCTCLYNAILKSLNKLVCINKKNVTLLFFPTAAACISTFTFTPPEIVHEGKPPTYCGLANNSNASLRIVGGTDAERFQYPWQTALVYKPLSTPERYKEHVFCGGSIISQSYILTAAHCLEGLFEDNFEVVVGEYDLSKKDGTEVRAGVAKIILHKAFTGDVAKGNDIGLIKLKEPLEFGPAVAPICLPDSDPAAGTKAIVTGWGVTDGAGSRPDVLQEVRVNIINDCRSGGHDYFEVVTMICAAAPSGDACQGDSGGKDWSLIGV